MQPMRKIMQIVVRTVTAEPFVVFNLACGHMVTEHADGRPYPAKMECWACSSETQKP